MSTSRQEENQLWQHKVALAARPQAPVAEPTLFDYLPMVAPAIEPDARSAPVAPSAPVEQSLIAPADLPGWPADVPQPPWWPEFVGCLGNIRLLVARRSNCPQCGFGVAIQWQAPGMTESLWSCPACYATAPDSLPAAVRLAEPERICRCGSTRYRDVSIHSGRSVRRDCARCGRFLGFLIWYRQRED